MSLEIIQSVEQKEKKNERMEKAYVNNGIPLKGKKI